MILKPFHCCFNFENYVYILLERKNKTIFVLAEVKLNQLYPDP